MRWQGEGIWEGPQKTGLGSPSHVLRVEMSTSINLPLFSACKAEPLAVFLLISVAPASF